MSDAAVFQALLPQGWPTFALVSARVSGVVMTAPVWTQRAIPVRVRGAFAVLLTVTLLPAVPQVAVPDAVLALPVPVLSELLLGAVIGLAAAVFLHGAAVGAEVAAVQMGLSLGAAIAPTADMGAPGIGQAQTTLVLLLYLSLGGPLIVIAGLAGSLDTVQPGTVLDLTQGATHIVALGSAVFSTAVRLAAPLIVALVLAHTAFALLNRAVPQINTLMLSFPVTIGVGLLMFGAALSFVGGVTHGWVDALPLELERLMHVFSPGAGGR